MHIQLTPGLVPPTALHPTRIDHDDLIVVAATNRPDQVDSAMKRPGRPGERMEIPTPGPELQVSIFHQ